MRAKAEREGVMAGWMEEQRGAAQSGTGRGRKRYEGLAGIGAACYYEPAQS